MSIEKFQPSYNIYPEKFEKLKSVFPEAFEDEKINWEILKECLGNFVEKEGQETEHYSFTWPGKKDARRLSGKPPQGTLIPAKDEGVDEDNTENLFIEGDNLEVLKLMQKSYAGRIKMIYIDPPYNTGNDFIYDDNFTQPLEEYLKLTGQIDAEGTPLVSNKKASGRFHTKWLNMMYPRLLLARNLLKDDGVIFISIDDNEVDNLKKICNEIFGEENFVAQIIIDGTPKNDPYIVSTSHEYCLVYTKIMDVAKISGYGLSNKHYIEIQKIWDVYQPDYEKIAIELREYYAKQGLSKDNISNYKFADEDGVFRIGPIDDPQNSGPRDERINPKTGKPCKVPGRGWSCTIETWNEWLEDNLIFFPEEDNISPSKKTYIFSDRTDVLRSYHKIQTRKDTDYLKRLFGTTINPFSNPKPRELIYKFIKNCNDKEMTVLDFFAGSGTTAEVAFQINSDEKSNLKFVLIQVPEKITLKGLKSNKEKKISQAAIDFLESIKRPINIAEIGKERIRRVIKKIREESKSEEIEGQDMGFKVFKLQKSHFKEWQDYKGTDINELMELFSKQEDSLVEGWKKKDLMIEVMLQEGFPLHSRIQKLKDITSNDVQEVSSEFCEHSLFISLDDEIKQETIDKLPVSDKDVFICLDRALTDEQKLRLSDKKIIKTI